MKKIFYIIFAVMLCFCLTMPCFAEETAAETTEETEAETLPETTPEETPEETPETYIDTTPETIPEENNPVAPPEIVEEAVTLWTRLQEAWENGDIQDVFVILWGAACTIVMFLLKHAGNVTSLKISADLKKSNGETTEKINELIGVQNTLEAKQTELAGIIEKANELIAKISPEIGDKIADVKIADAKNIDALQTQLSACSEAMIQLAQMMQIVHANNRNIPQPTKDMVNACYVKAVKAVKGETDHVEG